MRCEHALACAAVVERADGAVCPLPHVLMLP
jgi:hypothetical protein